MQRWVQLLRSHILSTVSAQLCGVGVTPGCSRWLLRRSTCVMPPPSLPSLFHRGLRAGSHQRLRVLAVVPVSCRLLPALCMLSIAVPVVWSPTPRCP
jgi:hypothetical protein